VGSKEDRDFSKVLGVWTKFCFAKGTFVVARESPHAVLGCRELCILPHAQSVRLLPVNRTVSLNHKVSANYAIGKILFPPYTDPYPDTYEPVLGHPMFSDRHSFILPAASLLLRSVTTT
jgi:hypothetical protein